MNGLDPVVTYRPTQPCELALVRRENSDQSAFAARSESFTQFGIIEMKQRVCIEYDRDTDIEHPAYKRSFLVTATESRSTNPRVDSWVVTRIGGVEHDVGEPPDDSGRNCGVVVEYADHADSGDASTRRT